MFAWNLYHFKGFFLYYQKQSKTFSFNVLTFHIISNINYFLSKKEENRKTERSSGTYRCVAASTNNINRMTAVSWHRDWGWSVFQKRRAHPAYPIRSHHSLFLSRNLMAPFVLTSLKPQSTINPHQNYTYPPNRFRHPRTDPRRILCPVITKTFQDLLCLHNRRLKIFIFQYLWSLAHGEMIVKRDEYRFGLAGIGADFKFTFFKGEISRPVYYSWLNWTHIKQRRKTVGNDLKSWF